MYTMTSGSVKFCLEIINNYYYIMIFSKIIASNFLQGYRPQHSRRIHACDKFSQYIIFTALFVLLMQVCGTKVISGRFILGNLLSCSLSTARSRQNSPAASTEKSAFQQKYCGSCIFCSSRGESVWIMDRFSAGMFMKFVRHCEVFTCT